MSAGKLRFDRRAVATVFGSVIREIRTARGLSQEALADRCGLDRTYPSLLERGQRLPTIGTIVRLAEALSVSAEFLVANACDPLRNLREMQPPAKSVRRHKDRST